MSQEIAPLKIVAIDDNWNETDPLVIELKAKYGSKNVNVFTQPQVGLDHIFASLANKTIVLLDYDFGSNTSLNGIEVLRQLREKTSLVYVIFMSAEPITNFTSEQLYEIINNHAFAFLPSSSTSKEFMTFVSNAEHELETRVDCAIEQWVLSHAEEDRDKPYIVSANGQKYSLNQLLIEIRQGTAIGRDIEKKLLALTIDLLTRNKKTL